MLTSTYETTARRPASTGGALPRAPRLGGPHVVSEPLTHEQPRAVDARLDRRQADPGRLRLARAQLLVRRVGGDPVEPAPEGGLLLERLDLADRGPQRILGRLLGILLGAGDPEREPVDAVAVGLHERGRSEERRVGKEGR